MSGPFFMYKRASDDGLRSMTFTMTKKIIGYGADSLVVKYVIVQLLFAVFHAICLTKTHSYPIEGSNTMTTLMYQHRWLERLSLRRTAWPIWQTSLPSCPTLSSPASMPSLESPYLVRCLRPSMWCVLAAAVTSQQLLVYLFRAPNPSLLHFSTACM